MIPAQRTRDRGPRWRGIPIADLAEAPWRVRRQLLAILQREIDEAAARNREILAARAARPAEEPEPESAGVTAARLRAIRTKTSQPNNPGRRGAPRDQAGRYAQTPA